MPGLWPTFCTGLITHTGTDRMAGKQESVVRAENGHQSQQAELAPAPSQHIELTLLHTTTHVCMSLGSRDFRVGGVVYFITLQRLVLNQVSSESVTYLAPFSVGRIHRTPTLHQNWLTTTLPRSFW